MDRPRQILGQVALLVVALTALSVAAPGASSARGQTSRRQVEPSGGAGCTDGSRQRPGVLDCPSDRQRRSDGYACRGGAAVTPAAATESTGFGTIAGGTNTATAAVTPSADYCGTPIPRCPLGCRPDLHEGIRRCTGHLVHSSCSATVIAAENKATVWTAAHCLYNTYINQWNGKIAFCPGYRDSNGGAAWQSADCQLGFWYPKYHSVPNGWINAVCGNDGRHCNNTEAQYDLGAMVMCP